MTLSTYVGRVIDLGILKHIVTGCSYLANGEYLHRHNQIAKIIHQQLAFQYDLVELEVPHYRYNPTSVLENSCALLYWDRPIITDRYIVANRLDIVLVDRVARRAVIVDVTTPHDDNLVKQKNNNASKWDVNATIILLIVVSVNRLIAKSVDQHLKKLSLSCWIKNQMQKVILLETARIVRRFFSLEP